MISTASSPATFWSRLTTPYQARVAQAEADLLGAEAAIENLKTRKALQHAQVAEAENAIAGTQVIAVVPLDNVWVIANYKETQLTHVAIGQRAEIRIDTFPGVAISATVDSIAPASGSQFSLLPPDNATGNFTKVVQRIPIK